VLVYRLIGVPRLAAPFMVTVTELKPGEEFAK